MQQTTFSYVESHFSEMYHRVIEEQDVLLVTQGEADNVVMMPQSLFELWQKEAEESPLKIPKLNLLQYTKVPTQSFQVVSTNSFHFKSQENSLKTLLASWSPLEEEFPEIADLPPVSEDVF